MRASCAGAADSPRTRPRSDRPWLLSRIRGGARASEGVRKSVELCKGAGRAASKKRSWPGPAAT